MLTVLAAPRGARADGQQPAGPPATGQPPTGHAPAGVTSTSTDAPKSPSVTTPATATAPATLTAKPASTSARTATRAAEAQPGAEAEGGDGSIEVVNLNPEDELDRQRFAVGIQLGGGWMTNLGSHGAGFGSFALAASIGLGHRGARVPWTLQPYGSFAITAAGLASDSKVHPNRFTELGARVIYRFRGQFEHQWLGLGLGIAWTSTKPKVEEQQLCTDPTARAEIAARKLECNNLDALGPVMVVDLGLGLHELVTRNARFGVALRTPIQVSAHPGFAVAAVFYGELGMDR